MCRVSRLASASITGAEISVWVMMLRSMRSVPTASTATLMVSSSCAVLVACGQAKREHDLCSRSMLDWGVEGFRVIDCRHARSLHSHAEGLIQLCCAGDLQASKA